MEKSNRTVQLISILSVVLIFVIMAKLLVSARISSVEDLQNYLKGFGVAAPLALTLFQAFQVVVPVVPGYLGCAAGAISLGTATGFVCNYVGISMGSIIAYFLARRYGMKVVMMMFSKKQFDHWAEKIKKKKAYGRFLFVATLLPLFPDDFLCYFSGLLKMSTKKFVWIILLGKPWCILAYSVVFGLIK